MLDSYDIVAVKMEAFKSALAEGDPCSALELLQQYLSLVILEKRKARSSTASISDAIELTKFAIENLQKIYLRYAEKLKINEKDPIAYEAALKWVSESIGVFKSEIPITADVNFFISNLPEEMNEALNELLNAITTEEFSIVSTYARLNCFLDANKYYFLPTLKFIQAETKLLKILTDHVFYPCFDSTERRMADCFEYEQNLDTGMSEWKCTISFDDNPAILDLEKVNTLLIEIEAKNLLEIKANDAAWLDSFYRCEMSVQTLATALQYVKKYSVILNKTVEKSNISQTVKELKAVLVASDIAADIVKELNVLKQEAEQLKREVAEKILLEQERLDRARKEKRKQNRGAKSRRKQQHQNNIAVIPAIALTPKIIPLSEACSDFSALTISTPVVSATGFTLQAPVAHEVVDDSECVASSSCSSTSSQSSTSSRAFTPNYESSLLQKSNFNSKKEKMLRDIFDPNQVKKIKYNKLMNFIVHGLGGYVKSDTGSSSRKIEVPLVKKICFHKRHGRDHMQFVDPNVVKAIREMLVALNITPDRLLKQNVIMRDGRRHGFI